MRWSGTIVRIVRFWASEMTFFRSARDENLRVEGPPIVGWQTTQFARMRSSLLQWSFCCPCSRNAAVLSYRPSSDGRSFGAPYIRKSYHQSYWVYENIWVANYTNIVSWDGTLYSYNTSLEARVLQQLKLPTCYKNFTIRFRSVALRFNFSQAELIFMPNNSI